MVFRIAVAPNAFRGSLTAIAATEAITQGLQQSALHNIEIVSMPLADSGDGTLDVLLSLGGERVKCKVTGPLGALVEAEFGLLADRQTAIIEMAQASGIELIPRRDRNPLVTTSRGTGELINEALRRGYSRILVTVGGSATVDGGAGCLQALGAKLLNVHGEPIPPGGAGLAHLAAIDLAAIKPAIHDASFTVLCDVTNPMIGPSGAARVFGPQKGANAEAVEVLERNLNHFAKVIMDELGIDIRAIPHGGAAGGLAAGLAALLKAKLVSGAETIIQMLHYEDRLKDCDLLITGEGRLDAQTEGGKAVQCIAQLAHKRNIPVVALAGSVQVDRATLLRLGIRAAWSIVPGPSSHDEALKKGGVWLTQAATRLGDTLALAGL